MKPGDIVLIRFPQTDLKVGKLRPALVVAVAPGYHADLLLALITSRIHQAVPKFDEIIDPSDSDYSNYWSKSSFGYAISKCGTVHNQCTSR